MGMQVNTNVAANNAYRNLATTQNDLSKSLEKLSSGLRINRAADDAAGLAISEGLKSQVGGLTVAARNAQDAVSVIQTAEGSLNEVQSILQRVRDLAVQAGNDSNNDESRAAIKTEVDALSKELTRISESTNFNGTQLLDGTEPSLSFQVGANGESSSQIKVNLTNANVKTVAGAIGGVSTTTAVTTVTNGAVTLSGVAFDAATVSGDVNIFQKGGLDFKVNFGTAGTNGGNAGVLSKLQTAAGSNFTITADTTDASKYIIESKATGLTDKVANEITVSATSAGPVAASGIAINAKTVSGLLTLTQANGGSPITFSYDFSTADASRTDEGIASLLSTSNANFSVTASGTTGEFYIESKATGLTSTTSNAITASGFTTGPMSTSGNVYAYGTGAKLTFTQSGGLSTGEVTMGAAYTTAELARDDLNSNATFNTKFSASVVANKLTITSLSTTLTNDSTNGITVSGTVGTDVTGTGTSTSQKAFSSSGTAISTDGPEVAAAGVTDGIDGNVKISTTANVTTFVGALDFSTAEKAALAITEIDDQISAVSTARAELGADQNRFESVIKILAVSKENLTAAGSRIRDTDMAEEMVKYTRANILSQAGTAMLAQANQSNSGVLQLLQ